MRFLIETWGKVWPNIVASALWVPFTLVHISRSNRKTIRLYLGKGPGPDNKENPDD